MRVSFPLSSYSSGTPYRHGCMIRG